MNDFFDKLGAVAQRVADNVSAEFSIAAQEQKVREAYMALGKLYYQSAQRDAVAEGPDFDEQVQRIEAALKRIAELRAGKHVEPDSDFVDV